MKPKYRLKRMDPHQLECLTRMVKTPRYGVFFEQRCGKTRVAVDLMGLLYYQEGLRRVFVSTTLSAVDEFAWQIEHWLNGNVPLTIIEYTTPQKAKKALDKAGPDDLVVCITNHEKLRSGPIETFYTRQFKPDMLVVDESHKLKSPSGTASKTLWRMARTAKTKRRYLMTGTPFHKRPLDVFSQFRIMDELLLGKAWTHFRNEYAKMDFSKGYPRIDGYQNMDRLEKIISKNSMRVMRADTIGEEEPIHEDVHVRLSDSDMKAYQQLKTRWVLGLADGDLMADTPAIRIMYLQMLAGGFAPDGSVVGNTSKVAATVDFVENLLEIDNSPVIVFHRFSEEGKALVRALRSKDLRVAAFNGSVDKGKRDCIKANFQAGQYDVLVMQIQTGVTGATFDRAHRNVFFSMNYSPTDWAQARDRVAGRGQDRQVENYYMVARGTVDSKILRVLRSDEDVSDAISRNYKWFLGGEDE